MVLSGRHLRRRAQASVSMTNRVPFSANPFRRGNRDRAPSAAYVVGAGTDHATRGGGVTKRGSAKAGAKSDWFRGDA